MELINFKGLNCYYNCMVTVASFKKINFPYAFIPLWAETEFKYDAAHNLFLTDRLTETLFNLGIKFEAIKMPSAKQLAYFTKKNQQLVIIGTDAYYLPWCQFYRTLHHSHYFIAELCGDKFVCHDPTFKLQSNSTATIKVSEISGKVSELLIPKLCGPKTCTYTVEDAAREILNNSDILMKKFFQDIFESRTNKARAVKARYIDALINNRYMFSYYLQTINNKITENFDKTYFINWTAARNGLYKTYLKGGFKTDGLLKMLAELIKKETDIAKSIISAHKNNII